MAGEQTDVLETFREYFVLISGRLLRAVPCLRAGIGHWLFGHARSLYRKPKVWCAGRDTPNAIRRSVEETEPPNEHVPVCRIAQTFANDRSSMT
jgi:hypothetical protein